MSAVRARRAARRRRGGRRGRCSTSSCCSSAGRRTGDAREAGPARARPDRGDRGADARRAGELPGEGEAGDARHAERTPAVSGSTGGRVTHAGNISSKGTSHWPMPTLTVTVCFLASTFTTLPVESNRCTRTDAPGFQVRPQLVERRLLAPPRDRARACVARTPPSPGRPRAAPRAPRPSPSRLPRAVPGAGPVRRSSPCAASGTCGPCFSSSFGSFSRRAIFRALLMPNWPMCSRYVGRSVSTSNSTAPFSARSLLKA